MNADDNSSTSNLEEDSIISSNVDDLSSVGYSWTEDWDYTCWDEPERRSRTPFSPPIPEYQGLKLEMLIKPDYMMAETKDGDTWGIGLRRKKKHKTTSPQKRLVLNEEEKMPESPKASPWKKVEIVKRKDPWAFLEPPKPVPPPPRPIPPPREDYRRRPPQSRNNYQNSPPNRTQRHTPVENKTSHTNGVAPGGRDPSKLCKYKDDCRMNKNGKCTMVHSLKEWKPRLCNFNTRCNRKGVCGYYHQDLQVRDFLVQMIKRKETIYQKNSVFYEKYLKA